jgi:MOSC domain-containing protein YiiM
MPVVISIQAARLATYVHTEFPDGKGREWTTAFFKTPLDGAARIGPLGLAVDEQADKVNHGGPDKAVLAYSADHYAYWRVQLHQPEMPHGGFGENLTIAGCDETTVCIGDTWRAGDIVFQVSQPRQPCWKMSRRWQVADLAKQVIANGKSGWYLRVLEPGELSAGTAIELIARPHPDWPVARASQVMYHGKDDLAAMQFLASLPELSAAWKETLLPRIARRDALPD